MAAEWIWSSGITNTSLSNERAPSARVGNRVYFFSEWTFRPDDRATIGALDFYDMGSNSWTALNRIIGNDWITVGTTGAVGCGDSVYFFYVGGDEGETGYWTRRNYIKEYNVTTNTYTSKLYREMGTFGGAQSGLVEDNGIIYILGGINIENLYTDNHASETVKTCWRYDPDLNQLSQLPDMPNARRNFQPVAIGNKIYCMGGEYNKTSDYSHSAYIVHECDVYDISSNSWKSVEKMLAPVNGYAATSDGEFIYVAGGYASVENHNLVFATQLYDISQDIWTYGQPLPTDSFPPISTGILFSNLQGYKGYFYNNHIYAGALRRSYNSPYYFAYLNTAYVNIVNASPSAGYIDRTKDTTFTWDLASNSPNVQQSSAQFQWRIKNQSASTTYNIGSNQYYIVPANTFPSNQIQWRVKATSTALLESNWTDWMDLTSIDQIHTKPTNLIPNGSKRATNVDIQLSWSIGLQSTGAQYQNGFQIQYAYNAEPTTDTGWANLTGYIVQESPTYTIPANTLSTATVYWRVRTYNTDGKASPWSDTAYFIAQGAPDPPVWRSVTTDSSFPTGTWTSQFQTGYQYVVYLGQPGAGSLEYDTGSEPGADTTHTVTEPQHNGNYTHGIRIKNELDLWSDWAYRSVSINAKQRMSITAREGEKIANGAHITFDVEAKA